MKNRRITSLALATATMLATTGFPWVNAATLLSREHTDIGLAFEDGALEPHIHAEAYDLEFAPDKAVLRVLPSAEEVVPAGGSFAFLGAPGAPTWILPQDEATAHEKGLLRLGLGAEELNPADFAESLTASLMQVSFIPEPGGSSGGKFAMFTTGVGGTPTLLMSTHDGIDGTDVASVMPGAHFDPNWAFSQPGRYEITFRFSGQRATGGTVTADATYTFVVKSHASAVGTQLAKGEPIFVGDGYALISKAAAVSVAPHGVGVSVLTLRGYGSSVVTAANDTALARVGDYTAEILVREGDAVSGLPGVKIRGLVDGFLTESGSGVVGATLLQGTGGVTKADDSILLAPQVEEGSGARVVVPVAREGGAVPSLPGFVWTKFLSYLPAEDGSVVVIGSVRNGVAGLNKTVAVRAVPGEGGFESVLLAATGSSIATDSGVHLVKSITRPTRPGTRAAAADGAVELVLGLDDGTNEIVRFASVPGVVE